MSEPAVTVLLVDDHSLVRRGFRRMLEDDPDIRVVAEASDGHAAVEAAGKFHPRVAVMDFAMPGMNGAMATRQVLKASPETAVLILSMHSEPSCVRTCLDAGAKGYLLKNAMDLDLVQAVKQVAGGECVLDPRLKPQAGPAD
jgi:DNA-binding NarL/FixJ family response regulator